MVFLPRELGHGLADAISTPLTDANPRFDDGSPVGRLHQDGPGPAIEMMCGAAPGAGADAATSALLDVLLPYILRTWYESRPGDLATGWGAALRDSDLPLRSVAERTGYASEFALAKAFKREFGTAPGRYRGQAAG
ncbi:AraC family transcriptional regulator [Nonomuraea rosea]|uniref:AraC family transcriptional regulator n=1 Tax=Nonomuraea rosea TaxID=638574 RepID=UPI0031E5CDCC